MGKLCSMEGVTSRNTFYLTFQETADVTNEVIKEMHHMYGTFRNMTDVMLIGEAEVCVDRRIIDKQTDSMRERGRGKDRERERE